MSKQSTGLNGLKSLTLAVLLSSTVASALPAMGAEAEGHGPGNGGKLTASHLYSMAKNISNAMAEVCQKNPSASCAYLPSYSTSLNRMEFKVRDSATGHDGYARDAVNDGVKVVIFTQELLDSVKKERSPETALVRMISHEALTVATSHLPDSPEGSDRYGISDEWVRLLTAAGKIEAIVNSVERGCKIYTELNIEGGGIQTTLRKALAKRGYTQVYREDKADFTFKTISYIEARNTCMSEAIDLHENAVINRSVEHCGIEVVMGAIRRLVRELPYCPYAK